MHLNVNSTFDISVCRRFIYLRLPLLGAAWIEWQGFGSASRPWLEHERTDKGEQLLWAGPVHVIISPAAALV